MSSIKLVCLVAWVALLAIAFVGASAAMAESTALCKLDSSPCPAGESFTHLHETSVVKVKFLGSPEMQCDALFLGDASELGSPLLIEGKYTYTNCGAGCSITEENGPAGLEVLWQEHE